MEAREALAGAGQVGESHIPRCGEAAWSGPISGQGRGGNGRQGGAQRCEPWGFSHRRPCRPVADRLRDLGLGPGHEVPPHEQRLLPRAPTQQDQPRGVIGADRQLRGSGFPLEELAFCHE
jgi:hypothetical protein